MNILQNKEVFNLIQIYHRHLNGENNIINELTNKCYGKFISFSVYDYEDYLNIELPKLLDSLPQIKKALIKTFPELFEYTDFELYFFMELIANFSSELYQVFNYLNEEINNLARSDDFNERIKWGRVWLEHFYFDVFKNEKNIFRYDLIKYLYKYNKEFKNSNWGGKFK